MDIKYLGHSSFQIKTKTASIVTDPFNPDMVGMKFPKIEADIVTISHHHSDHNEAKLVGGEPLVIDWPGEFEKKGVRIFGFKSYHDKQKGAERGENILYKFEADNVSLLHCGDLGVIPSDEFIEELGEVNILLIPVGGVFTIDPSEAESLVKKIEPDVVIPMHYNTAKLNQEKFGKLASLPDFLSKVGASEVQPISKYSVKHEDLQGGMKVVVLE